MLTSFLHSGVADIILEPAHVAAHSHMDISIISPPSAPGVLHDPVRIRSRLVVPHGQDSVVELTVLAQTVVVDSTAVVLEGRSSVHGDRQGVTNLNQSGLHLVLVRGNLFVSADVADELAVVLATLSVVCCVGVGLLRLDPPFTGDVLPPVDHVATVAVVAPHAVNHLLLAHRHQLSVCLGPDSLDSSRGAEGPAASTP